MFALLIQRVKWPNASKKLILFLRNVLKKLLALTQAKHQAIKLIPHQILRQWLQIATLAKLQTEIFIIMANSLLLSMKMDCVTLSDAQVPIASTCFWPRLYFLWICSFLIIFNKYKAKRFFKKNPKYEVELRFFFVFVIFK